MHKLYRFSPIKDEKELEQVLDYLTTELEKLSRKLFDHKLPITTLKIFSHYQDEYEYLHNLVIKMGPKASFSSETSTYVQVSKNIRGYDISYLGIRIVDPYRLHVGCGDYEIDNFDEFKKKYAGKTPCVRDFSDDMIEIWHPEYDVLGYVISK